MAYKQVALAFCFVFLRDFSSSQTWNKFDDFEYYHDASGNGVINSYDKGVSRCEDLNATLVAIKSAEVENFILDLPGLRKLPNCTYKLKKKLSNISV